MAIRNIDTHISLPPDSLSTTVARDFLDMALQKFHWFEPRRYGDFDTDKFIAPGGLDLERLIGYYEEHRSLCVAARSDRDFIWLSPSLSDDYPCVGMLTWTTSAADAHTATWREAHARQVAEVMRLVQSPLAVAGLEEDIERKTRRLVPQAVGSRLDFTVRDYSEGLAGLFWRNFFGPPFVRLFGERLASLPPDSLQHLGDELVLVQPYPSPSEAGSTAAQAREHHLISLLGPECFYNHTLHQPPTRRPVLEHLGQPIH